MGGASIPTTWCSLTGCHCNTEEAVSEHALAPTGAVSLSATQCNGNNLCPGYADGDCQCTPGGGGAWYMWTCTKRQGTIIPTTWCSLPGCHCITEQAPTELAVVPKVAVSLSATQCNGNNLCSGYADGDCQCTPGGRGAWYMWTCTKRQGATIPTTWCSLPGCHCNTEQAAPELAVVPKVPVSLSATQCNGN